MSPEDTFHSCSCGGSNENCYRCAGTGISGVMPGKPGAPLTAGEDTRKSACYSRPNPEFKSVTEQINSIYCSACKANFNRLYWKKHLRTVHGTPGRSHSRPDRKSKAPVLYFCSMCRKKFRAKEFNEHMKLVHRSQPRGRLRVTRQEANSVEAQLGSIDNDRQERLLDRTKNYGFPCRENGRYGSHPSHDGFDDESKP